MQAYQKSKLDMYKAVAKHCGENFALISAIPALLNAFNSLTSLITKIDNTTKQHTQGITGFTIGKLKSRRVLSRLAATLAGKLYAYADTTGNDELKERMRLPYRIILRLKDNELTATCSMILDAASENLAALAEYNVTADTLTSLSESIAAYKELQTNPRNAIVNRVNYNKELKGLFISGDALFNNQLDRIMEEYRQSQPNFFNRYTTNRIILDPPTTSTQIKGDVTGQLSQKPITGAVITIEETGQTATTKANGAYAMKKLQPGTHTVTITKPGYKSQTVPDVLVKLGQITRVNFELVVEKI